MTSTFLDDDIQGKYYIIEDHDIEILDGFEYNENVSGTSISSFNDCEFVEVGEVGEVGEVDEAKKPADIERCEKHDEREIREKCVNSVEKEIQNEKSEYIRGVIPTNTHINTHINTNVRGFELTINTSTVDEVVFKKHRVEILHKETRARIMEGVVSGYTLVGRVYDPDIILNFDDGRSFYNENFQYLMRFYM
jgi:hypothetical protein